MHFHSHVIPSRFTSKSAVDILDQEYEEQRMKNVKNKEREFKEQRILIRNSSSISFYLGFVNHWFQLLNHFLPHLIYQEISNSPYGFNSYSYNELDNLEILE